MNRLSAVATSVMALLSAPAQAEFAVDMTAEAIRNALRAPALEDLHVGEVGMLQNYFLCNADGTLAVEGITPLAKERPKYATYITARRLPGGLVDLVIHSVKNDQTEVDDRLLSVVQYSIHRTCEAPLKIESINGMISLSSLVADLASRPKD